MITRCIHAVRFSNAAEQPHPVLSPNLSMRHKPKGKMCGGVVERRWVVNQQDCRCGSLSFFRSQSLSLGFAPSTCANVSRVISSTCLARLPFLAHQAARSLRLPVFYRLLPARLVSFDSQGAAAVLRFWPPRPSLAQARRWRPSRFPKDSPGRRLAQIRTEPPPDQAASPPSFFLARVC